MTYYAELLNSRTVARVFTPLADSVPSNAPNLPLQFVQIPAGATVSPGDIYDTASGTFSTPDAPVVTAAQQVQNAFDAATAAGVTITSASTPALNGVYALSDAARGLITSEQVYIATTGKFTNGQTSRNWQDQAGGLHLFPTTAAFTAFAEAAAFYYDALITALDTGLAGGAWVSPPQPAALP